MSRGFNAVHPGRVRQLVLITAVVATIGCDRVTKHVAETTLADRPARSYLADTVRVGYAENTGGFLSLGAAWPPGVRTIVFTGGTGAMLVALAVFGIRARWTGWPAVGLVLFVSGGASNWIDRFARGSVVDFLNVGVGPLRTGIFNVADVALSLGAVLIVAGAYLERRAEHARAFGGRQ
jgi:signal peptidase II